MRKDERERVCGVHKRVGKDETERVCVCVEWREGVEECVCVCVGSGRWEERKGGEKSA